MNNSLQNLIKWLVFGGLKYPQKKPLVKKFNGEKKSSI